MVRYARGLAGQLNRGRTGPVEWGQENYLYPQNIEDAFARLETIVAPIYRALLAKQPPDFYQRLLWSHWLLCQHSRTPSYIIDFAKLQEDVRTHFSDFVHLDSEINSEEKFESALDNIIDTFTSSKFIPFFAVRDWVVCEAAPGFCFPRSDDPIVITGPLVRENTQIIYPISPKLCFVALVVGEFPPTAHFFTHQLSAGDSLRLLKLVANKTDRELVIHPDDDKPELKTILQDSLGDRAGHFYVGDAFPDLRNM